MFKQTKHNGTSKASRENLSSSNSMGRPPSSDKNNNGLKKGPWTPEEDQKLIDYIQKHGYGNWRTLPKNAGLQRCGKSCRLRWTNYLRPDIKRGRISFEEEETIIQLHNLLGNKWSAIAARLPGRTDNEIKNYWNTHIRKKLLQMGIDPVTHCPRLDLLDLSSILSCSSLYNHPSSHQMNISRQLGVHPCLVNPELVSLAASLISTQRGGNQNQHFVFQNVQESHLCNPHQSQYQLAVQPDIDDQLQIPFQEIPAACSTLLTTTTIDPCVSFSNEQAQFMDPINAEQYPTKFTSFNNQNGQYSELKSNGIPSNLTEDYDPITPNYGYYASDQTVVGPSSESSNFHSNNNSNQKFNLASVLSTPSSSSPSPLNSNSYERESYCNNNLLKFEIPDILDISINSCNF